MPWVLYLSSHRAVAFVVCPAPPFPCRHPLPPPQNLASMFTHVNTISKQNPSQPRLFPKAALAVGSASDNAPMQLDVASLIATSEAQGQRSTWAEVTPSSVLLLPTGQSTGVVADLLGVICDEKTGRVALELEVVHDPHTISEFEAHGQQTLQVCGPTGGGVSDRLAHAHCISHIAAVVDTVTQQRKHTWSDQVLLTAE